MFEAQNRRTFELIAEGKVTGLRIDHILLSPALIPGHVLSPLDNLFQVAPWQAIAPGKVQANPALDDITQVFHPWVLYGAREIAAGRLPLWNPYAYTGAPFLSNPQTATLFPLTWLAWALPPALALTLPSLLKLVAAGLAMYWFLRLLALMPAPAFIGAAGYMLSSTLIAWLPWTFATTMVFVPLLFALVERLTQRGAPRDVALLALAVGLDVLAGYPQATLHALLATRIRGFRSSGDRPDYFFFGGNDEAYAEPSFTHFSSRRLVRRSSDAARTASAARCRSTGGPPTECCPG